MSIQTLQQTAAAMLVSRSAQSLSAAAAAELLRSAACGERVPGRSTLPMNRDVALRTFEGAVAVVTGGASGIGRALGEALAGRGARVVRADLQVDLAQAVAADKPNVVDMMADNAG